MFSRITRSNIQEKREQTREFIWRLNTYNQNGVSYDNFSSLHNTAMQWKTAGIFQQGTAGSFPGFQNLCWLFLMQNPNFYQVVNNFYCALIPQLFIDTQGIRVLFPGENELWIKAFQELYSKVLAHPTVPVVIPITMGKEMKMPTSDLRFWDGHSIGMMILPSVKKIVLVDPDGFDNLSQDVHKRGEVEFAKGLQMTLSQLTQTPYELVTIPANSLQQAEQFEDTACAIWTTWIMINLLHGCDIRNPAINTPEYQVYRSQKQQTSVQLVSFVCDAILAGLQHAKNQAEKVRIESERNQVFVNALVDFLIDVSAVSPQQVQKMTQYLECRR